MTKIYLYGLYNKQYGERFEGVLNAPSDAMCIRENYPFLKRQYPHLEEDYEIVRLGYILDDCRGVVVPLGVDEQDIVPWDTYRFHENQVTPLTDEQKRELQNK